jgi:hypothetical protein
MAQIIKLNLRILAGVMKNKTIPQNRPGGVGPSQKVCAVACLRRLLNQYDRAFLENGFAEVSGALNHPDIGLGGL